MKKTSIRPYRHQRLWEESILGRNNYQAHCAYRHTGPTGGRPSNETIAHTDTHYCSSQLALTGIPISLVSLCTTVARTSFILWNLPTGDQLHTAPSPVLLTSICHNTIYSAIGSANRVTGTLSPSQCNVPSSKAQLKTRRYVWYGEPMQQIWTFYDFLVLSHPRSFWRHHINDEHLENNIIYVSDLVLSRNHMRSTKNFKSHFKVIKLSVQYLMLQFPTREKVITWK